MLSALAAKPPRHPLLAAPHPKLDVPDMSSRFANNRTNRKSSNAENLAPRAKHVPYKAMRLASPDPVRNSSIRRRNRILSGPNHIQHKAKRSKLHRPNVAVTLPTPPTSRAPSVAEMSDIEFAESQPGQSKIRLPRRLRRPVFKRIDPEVLAAVDPATLTNVPAEYVRRGLEALGPKYVFAFRFLFRRISYLNLFYLA